MINSLLFLFLLINVSWSQPSQKAESVIVLKPKDYSKSRVLMTSDLPRTPKVAERNKYNFNDMFLELEDLSGKYVPKVDLGSGTPNYLPAQNILDALIEIVRNQTSPDSWQIHQYERARGNIELVTVVAKMWSKLLKRDINPMTEVTITVGNMHGLDMMARAYLNKGDEAIVFEPFFPYYRNFIQLVGAKMSLVPLKLKPMTSGYSSNDYTFDQKELEAKINKRTKLIWLNNPNNPFGKMFTKGELTFIGSLAIKYDLIILADEAAQWYTYESEHIRIASLPGLYERTITLNSGGKMFSNTGWRIAWAIGPERLLWPLVSLTVNSPSGVATPLQMAFAKGLQKELENFGKPDSYLVLIKKNAKSTMDKLVGILKGLGVDIVAPTAGYCVWANFTKFAKQVDLSAFKDDRPGMRFYKYVLIKGGINTYPLAYFYGENNMWNNEYTIRFTNLKTTEQIDQFGIILNELFKKIVTNYALKPRGLTSPLSKPIIPPSPKSKARSLTGPQSKPKSLTSPRAKSRRLTSDQTKPRVLTIPSFKRKAKG